MSNNSLTLKQLTLETAEAFKEQLRDHAEVRQIANQINIKNQIELLALGKEPSTKLATFADQILDIITQSTSFESNELFKQLEALMQTFDKQDFTEQKGFFKKLFARKTQNDGDLFTKYNRLGRDIEKIHYQFVLMEEELAKDNRVLARLYQEDLMYYLELEKYIVATDMKLHEVQTTLIPMYEKQSEAGNQLAKMELNRLQAIAEMLQQKIDDLEKSRMVAIITAPQIDMLRNGNSELIEQINGAFVKTIPVFKMGLMNAVNERRQQLQSQSASAFEERMKQFGGASKEAVQLSTAMAQQSSTTQTLEEMWDTIISGIANYQQLRDEQTVKRQQAEQQLLTLRS
ncbi:tellurite resistance protein [Lysinibacillus fusiformis ZC1]|uniref:toxic anion resistance protein n=1 Tax=Lysinibacillus capsici TaxID=2115968 RepID=UPI0001DA503F|nr:toxic anion resistance protein [Lysinibacillus capsici]EFI67738.1 tellurite resistance protein [Lysinibacillus fusiformis ZC1]MBU5254465.1 toxic anion resistance protein [Lysinibacillus capsici]